MAARGNAPEALDTSPKPRTARSSTSPGWTVARSSTGCARAGVRGGAQADPERCTRCGWRDAGSPLGRDRRRGARVPGRRRDTFAPCMLTPGATFDRYRIEALLGEGGMGSVYRALRRAARPPRRAQGPARRRGRRSARRRTRKARLLREARAAAALDHPNAVAIFDVGEHRRRAVHRDGARRRAHARARSSATRDRRSRERVALARRRRARARRRAPRRPRPPRHQARERDGPRRRRREGARLRHRAPRARPRVDASAPTDARPRWRR